MMKILKKLICIALVVLPAAGCSSSDAGIAGIYELTEIRDGEAVTSQNEIADLKKYGLYSWIEIKENGTAELHDFGEDTAYACDEKKKTFTAAGGEEPVLYRRKGDVLVLGDKEHQQTFRRVEDADAFLYAVTPHVPDSPWSAMTMQRAGSADTGYYDVPDRWFPVLSEDSRGMQIWTDGMYFRLSVITVSSEERAGWNDQSPEFALELYAHDVSEEFGEQIVWKDYEQFDFGGHAVKECGMSFNDGTWMVIDVFLDEKDRMQYFVFESDGTDAGNHLNEFKEHTLNSFRTES
ncbi:MAG: hypothetical protein IKF51_06300 [Solobacterium sp.]|nr:hypothetical protein [Solobacterium sp.]